MLNKLKKLKMPASKKAAPDELDLAAGEEGAEEEEELALELPELEAEEGEEMEEAGEELAEEEAEGEEMEMEPLDLSALSDEELMAELKKRGLMGKMKA